MSEEKERAESATEATIAGVDPIAVALALGGASREDANAFLQKQASLIDLQKHHLHEQFKHLHLGIWEKKFGVMLRVATMIMGVVVAGSLGFMVWQASQSNGLLVEPFSVPPDMAGRGLTGEVVASRVLDRLSLMQSQTNTGRPARSYANAWGEHGMKMEIPETGISLAELDNWLRQKLGHDIRVTGEIVRNASGVTITARAGDEGAETVSGPDGDVDAMVKQLAESIYRLTQPYRYAMYLATNNRADEAVPRFRSLALSGSPQDQVWAYNMWGNWTSDAASRIRLLHEAVAAYPDAIGANDNLGGAINQLSQPEEALHIYERALANWSVNIEGYPNTVQGKRRAQSRIDQIKGAYHDVIPVWAEFRHTGLRGFSMANIASVLARAQFGEHDLGAARATLAGFSASVLQRLQLESEAGNWAGVAALGDADAVKTPPDASTRLLSPRSTVPLIAYARARLGDVAGAQAQIAATPLDCYICLRTRARLAELRGQQAQADTWFARAVAFAPSIPLAELEWGQALLARGKVEEATEKFKLANQKSPHFADPLEGWGEALMAKNQSHLALAKFAEAEKYAPNWGRLHLKWGEALNYAGKRDEAKAHFARAAALDLTPSEKSELARITVHV